jgi:hypothetical protein
VAFHALFFKVKINALIKVRRVPPRYMTSTSLGATTFTVL